jgi:hypothetical protein
MGCFERRLQIAPYHTLVQVRTHGCGGWRKFDIAGRLMETGTFAHLDDAPFDET